MPRQALGCDPRALAEPGHRGHHTLGRRDTLPQRHEPLLLPTLLRVQPALHTLLPQRRGAGAGAGTAAQAVPAKGWIWAGSQQLPRGTFQPRQKNRSPRALVSWATGLPLSRCREELPVPPGSRPAARWKTTVRFVLSQATKEQGKSQISAVV